MSPLQRLLFVLILIVPAGIRLFGIDADLVGPDEWRETDTATIARHFLDEPNVLYPRINWGAPGPGYVEAELQLMPWVVHLLYRAFGPEPWLGRAFAVLLATLATALLWKLARHVMRPWPALLAAFAFTSAPLLFRYGRAFMPEAAVLVFYVLAAERFAAWLRGGRWSSILGAGVAMAFAILIKPTSIHLGLVACLFAWRRGGLRCVFGPRMLSFAAVALLPAIAYFAHAMSLHREHGNTFGVISGGDSKWGNVDWWFDPKFYHTLQTIDVVYGVGYTGSLLVLLAMFWARPVVQRYSAVAWMLVILVYYLIVARYAGHEKRGLQYHVYAVVPLSLGVAAGSAALWRLVRARVRSRWLGWALVALPLVAMTAQQWRSNVRFLALPKDQVFWRAGHALADVSSERERAVVTSTDSSRDGAVANNFEEPKVLFHAWRQGRMLPRDRLTRAHLEAALARADAQFVVVLDAVMADAQSDFQAALAGLRLAIAGDGFRIYRAPPR